MEIERMTPQRLRDMLYGGESVTVIDVRSAEAYEALHVPGALNIPKGTISSACSAFPKEGRFVLY